MKGYREFLEEGFSHYISHKTQDGNVVHPAVVRTKDGNKEDAIKKYMAREKIKRNQITVHEVERNQQDVD